jgi:hypothetical protein
MDAPESTAPEPEKKRLTYRQTLWLLGLGIVLLAFLIRALGVGWGLANDVRNHSLHPDEMVVLSYAQSIDPASLDFDPGFYNYGTLYLTLLKVTTTMVDTYAPAEGEEETWERVSLYHEAGRWLSVVAGAATAGIVFAILAGFVGRVGAGLGALAVAFAPGHVIHSRFQTVDVVAACLLAASLYFALRVFHRDRQPIDAKFVTLSMVWAGVFAGLSAGTKYTGILVLLVPVVAYGVAKVPGLWRALGLGVLAAVITFLLATPGAVLNSGQFLQDFLYEMEHTSTGHGLVFAGTTSGFLYHLGNLAIGMGFLVVVLGGAGLIGGAIKRHAWLIGLLAFALVYYVLIGRAEVKFFRYTLPLIPALALGYGWLMGQGHQLASKKGRLLVAVGFLGLVGLLGGGLIGTIYATQWMLIRDPRDAAGDYVKQVLEPGQNVGIVREPWFWSPTLYDDIQQHPQLYPGTSTEEKNAMRLLVLTRRGIPVVYAPADDPDELEMLNPDLITELAPEYIAFSSFEYSDAARLMNLPRVPEEYRPYAERAEAFTEALEANYELVRVFGLDEAGQIGSVYVESPLKTRHDLEYVRPTVWVWKRNDLESPSSGSSTTLGTDEAPASTP